MSGSKVAAILLKGWILPFGGSSAVHRNFVSLNKFNKTTATFRWPICSMCLHMSVQIISGKILFLYVFAYVSCNLHFGEILPNTPCKKQGLLLLDVLPYVSPDYFTAQILRHTLYS